MSTSVNTRQPSRPAAHRPVPPPHHNSDRHRDVLRRFRYLSGRHSARRHLEDRFLDTATKRAVHLGDLRRHDAGLVCDRLSRRPLRTAVHLPVQPAGVRHRLAGGGVCPKHDGVDRLPFRDGFWLGRRKRRRLFDHDRIRAGKNARQMARNDGGLRRDRLADLVAGRVPGGAGVRLARNVRHRRHRRLDRLVHAQEPAEIAALAGSRRPH